MSCNWQLAKLRDVLDLVVDNRGRNPKSYSESGIPVIDNYLIVSEAEVNITEVKRFIDEDTYNTFIRKYITERDVLMTLVGNGYGKVAITPSERCIIIQNTIGLRCNEYNDNQYLYYLLRANREALMNLNRGAAQPSIKVGDILNLEFKFPSLNEQRRIGKVLGSLDKKRIANTQTNQTLEEMAQAIFKSWFVDFDPVKAKMRGEQPEGMDAATAALFPKNFVESKLGLIPEGWTAGSIDDIAELNASSWTKKNSPTTVNYVDLANTKNGVIEAITPYKFEDAPSRARRVLTDGDTIVGTVRPGNRSFAYIGDTEQQLTASTGFAVLTPKEKYWSSFIYLATTKDDSIDRYAHLADGGAYPAIKPTVVTETNCALPIKDIIQKFWEISSPLLKKIHQNRMENQSLTELRDTLLPKLLSGEIELSE